MRSSLLFDGSDGNSSSINSKEGNLTSYQQHGTFKDRLHPYLKSPPRNDSLNELPVGPLPGKNYNNNRFHNNSTFASTTNSGAGIKRIAMEGSVNEVPNFYKRYGKFPSQNRGLLDKINGHQQQTTQKPALFQFNNSTTSTTIASHARISVDTEDENDSNSSDSQLENEILESETKLNTSASYQTDILSNEENNTKCC